MLKLIFLHSHPPRTFSTARIRKQTAMKDSGFISIKPDFILEVSLSALIVFVICSYLPFLAFGLI
jgi:hypothetical protein